MSHLGTFHAFQACAFNCVKWALVVQVVSERGITVGRRRRIGRGGLVMAPEEVPVW